MLPAVQVPHCGTAGLVTNGATSVAMADRMLELLTDIYSDSALLWRGGSSPQYYILPYTHAC